MVYEADIQERSVADGIRMEIEPGEYGPWYEGCGIGETLKMLPPKFADAEIKETRWFFDTFVIELASTTV